MRKQQKNKYIYLKTHCWAVLREKQKIIKERKRNKRKT